MFWRGMALASQDHRPHGGNVVREKLSSGERVYLAMLSRGYDGTMHVMDSERFGKKEGVFLLWIPLLLFLRILLG